MSERLRRQSSIIERLRRESPRGNIVFAAIDKLKTSEEIRRFRDEYEEDLAKNARDRETRNEPGQAADFNIGHFLGLHPGLRLHTWMGAFQGTPHYHEFKSALDEAIKFHRKRGY